MQSLTKNRKSRDDVDTMARHVFDGIGVADTDDAVVELTDGWFNAVYRVLLADGRRTVLKIAPPDGAEVMTYEAGLMATEVATMRLVAADPGIPVPAVHGYDTSRERCDADYFFMAEISGRPLAHATLTPDERVALDHEIGRIIRRVNAHTNDWFGIPGHPGLRSDTWRGAFGAIVESVLIDGEAREVDLGRPSDEVREVFARHADALDEVTEARLVHWDAWDLNWFVDGARPVGLVDFERAMWGDPLMEAHFRAVTWGRVSDAMRGYGRTDLTRSERVRCHLATLHLGLVMRVECAYRHYDTDEVHHRALQLIDRAIDALAAEPPA